MLYGLLVEVAGPDLKDRKVPKVLRERKGQLDRKVLKERREQRVPKVLRAYRVVKVSKDRRVVKVLRAPKVLKDHKGHRVHKVHQGLLMFKHSLQTPAVRRGLSREVLQQYVSAPMAAVALVVEA
jgi:hypothetical protein